MEITRRRLLTLGGTALAAGLPLSSAHGAPSAGRQAINKAGQLRMLSQRILKAYAQLGLGVMPKESAGILSRSVASVNANLADLRGVATADAIKASLTAVEKAWTELRDRVSAAPNKGDAAAIAKLGDAMLAEADRLTSQFENALGTDVGKIVGLAGRQRMLAQKAARHYFFAAWGVADKADRPAFDRTRDEFHAALATLKAFPQNSAEIKNRVTMLDEQWTFMVVAFNLETMSVYSPGAARNVAMASENILALADELTGFYENLKL